MNFYAALEVIRMNIGNCFGNAYLCIPIPIKILTTLHM